MCLYRPLVAIFVVLENSFLVKSGRGQTKLSFGTPSFDVWCLIPEHTVWEGPVRPKKVSAIGTPKIQNFRSFPTTYAKIKIFWRRFLEKSRFKDFPL